MIFNRRDEGEAVEYGFNYGYLSSGEKTGRYKTFILKIKWTRRLDLMLHLFIFPSSVSKGMRIRPCQQ